MLVSAEGLFTSYTVSKVEVRNLISEKWSQFAGYRQHDAQELLMFLLDGLHEDVTLGRETSGSKVILVAGSPTLSASSTRAN